MKNLHRADVQQLILMLGSTLIYGSILFTKAFYIIDDFTKYTLLFISISGPITLYALILLYKRFRWTLIGIILINVLIMIGYVKGTSALASSQGQNLARTPAAAVLLFGAVVVHFLIFVYFVWFFRRKKRRLNQVKEDLTDFPLVSAVIPKGTALVYIILFILFTFRQIL